MIDYSSQNKPVQVGTRVINAGYNTGLGVDTAPIQSTGTAAAGGAATGATIGSIVPGVGTAIGGIVGGVVGALSSLFGGKDNAARDEAAAAAAEADVVTINGRGAALRANSVYQYYAKNKANSLSAYMDPPAFDARGNATEASQRIDIAVDILKTVITADPLFKKWANQKNASGHTPAALMGAGYGASFPEILYRLNETMQIIGDAERGLFRVATTEAQPTYPGPVAPSQPSIMDAAISYLTGGPAPVAPTTPISGIAGMSMVTPMQPPPPLPPPATASMLGIPSEVIAKYAPIAVGVLTLGFLFSTFGRGPLLPPRGDYQ